MPSVSVQHIVSYIGATRRELLLLVVLIVNVYKALNIVLGVLSALHQWWLLLLLQGLLLVQ